MARRTIRVESDLLSDELVGAVGRAFGHALASLEWGRTSYGDEYREMDLDALAGKLQAAVGWYDAMRQTGAQDATQLAAVIGWAVLLGEREGFW